MLNLIYGNYLSHSHAVSPDPHATRLDEPKFSNMQHTAQITIKPLLKIYISHYSKKASQCSDMLKLTTCKQYLLLYTSQHQSCPHKT